MIKIAIALYLANTAVTAFDYRESSPISLFPFYNAVIEYSQPDTISNPAYLPFIKYPYIHFSGSKPYTLDELYSSTLRLGYGFKYTGFQLTWNRFGMNEYMENIIEANCGFMPIKYFSLGIGINYYNISINTIESSLKGNIFDGRISVLIAPFKWIQISFQHENIASIFYKNRGDILFPGWSAGLSIKPVKGFSLIWNINNTPYGYVNSISASANLLKFISIKVGYAREATTFSAAFSFIYKYMSVSYGLRYHPHLKLTHSVGLTLALNHIDIESIEYRNPFPVKKELKGIKKIDINICSIDELKEIPDLAYTHADRIIKYRKMIGAISRKSLAQIGMSKKEIEHLLQYVFGLQKEKDKSKRTYGTYRRNRRYNELARKNLFRKLLHLGLNASTALKISEMAANGKRSMILSEIDSLPEVDKLKKKKILETCSELF